MRGLVLIALFASACSFSPGYTGGRGSSDAMPDGPPAITVGFGSATTLTDENAGTEQVRVILSKPAEEAISVAFAVTGGTANRPNDYLLTDGTLTFAIGDVEKTIDIMVGPDAMAEPDETIELTLSNPTGGAALGLAMHTVTISANVLPRVTFSAPTSSGDEPNDPTIMAMLDVASPLITSVEVNVMAGAGTTATGGTDYMLTTTTVTFNPNETSKPVVLDVLPDTMDEPNEDITLELVNPVNILVGTQGTTKHTINDEDAAETVQFTTAATPVREGMSMVNVEVSLVEVSGKSFNLPFSVDGSSTATMGAGNDFTVVTASPLAFPAGTATATIQIAINDDAVIEQIAETIVLTLGNPMPMPNATVGANNSHTVTINDNDVACGGPKATNFELCFPTPAAAATVSGMFDTDTSMMCAAAAPLSGWTGGPNSCFVVATDITVNATTVVGSRPLVLFATGSITVADNLDVSSHQASGTVTGPGANPSACGTYSTAPGVASTDGSGGGAGGTFRTQGGNGGTGNGSGANGGLPIAINSVPTVLRGGCPGQRGADGVSGGGNNGGLGGNGGGALYLVAGDTITITSGKTINASGGGGTALANPDSGHYAGGGGGGSGGMIVLFANTFAVSGAQLMTNGGGGSAGADDNSIGGSGNDPSTTSPTQGGSGGSGSGAGGSGGRGFGSTTAVANGGTGNSSNEAGGGGGGGGGYIASNKTLTGATISTGDLDP